MRKKIEKIIKVSIRGIKRIKAANLSDAARVMIKAISSQTIIFKGEQPYTLLQIEALIKAFDKAKSFYKLNGTMGKDAYLKAKAALTNSILEFEPYVNDIAKGNKEILALSTLPTTETLKDIAKLILEGAVATGIKFIRGRAGRVIIDCNPFGEGVNYIVLLSEDVPLMDGFYMNSSGQIVYPAGVTNKVIIDINGVRRKSFINLEPTKLYYAHYIMVFGSAVSKISVGKKGNAGY